MTDISVRRTGLLSEKRGWLRGPHGTEPGANPSITLDLSKFTKATHYPDGFIPSGTLLAVDANGIATPPATGDEATGLLFSSVAVNDPAGKVGGALFVHGFVDEKRLPASTKSLMAAAKPVLTHIIWN